MARIGEFGKVESSGKLHPTEVECGYSISTVDGATFVELRTYGSESRRSDKKVSQTLQLDRAAATRVMEILEEAFPGLRTAR
jgi:5-methylcytosine-specific restriction protein B